MYTVFVSCYACVRVRENVSTPEDLLPSARQPAHGLGSLRYSLAVTHPGTNRGGRCLTSLIETNVVPLRHTAFVIPPKIFFGQYLQNGAVWCIFTYE